MPADERIRHVVVLMLENHSFDHLLGFLGPAFPGQPFEGLRELLVSPWLERGKVDQTVYDHASLLATVKKLFGLPRFLNQRDDTFDHNFTDRGPIMSMMMQPQPQPQRQPQPEPQHSLEPAQVSNEKQLEEQCRVQEREEQSRAHEEERRKRDDQQRQALEEQRRQELVNRYKDELFCALEQTLTDMGYNPPDPSPFLRIRAVQRLRHTEQSDLAHGEAMSLVATEVNRQFAASLAFAKALQSSVGRAASIISHVKMLMAGIDRAIAQATLSFEPPKASAQLQERMHKIERFLADPWMASAERGILAIHVDEAHQQTILQIGISEHGALYVTIPGVLVPQNVAEASIRDLIAHLTPFTAGVDPLAVVNGAYPRINFNQLFKPGRVIRAPSGDTSRLSANLAETLRRERLSPDNTVVFNSAPASVEEYVRIFPDDRNSLHWGAWGQEATLWNNTASSTGFVPATEASREALLASLTQRKNVIVIVAHCDGHDLFMPHPPPEGTQVSAQYLLDHRNEIAANRPFVYLFSCEAGNLDNLENFASTLLEAGAAGVVASQRTVGSAEGRNLLGRILDERRGTPPIEDLWGAMRDTNYLDMEVFLA